MKKRKDILTSSPELSQCFPEAPKVMYQRKRGIKDILCKSDITPNPGSDKTKVHNHPCGHGNCRSFSKTNVITNRQNGHKFNISQGGTCRTKNIIYAAECVRHKKIYIGQSKTQLNKRFCGHRYDIKKAVNNLNSTDIGGTELSDDFAKTPHGAGDLRVGVLDSSEKWNEIDRLTMEISTCQSSRKLNLRGSTQGMDYSQNSTINSFFKLLFCYTHSKLFFILILLLSIIFILFLFPFLLLLSLPF